MKKSSPPRIDGFSFGSLVIDGKMHTDDLIILPDGEILKPWRRKRGHQLSMHDLRELIASSPEVIVIGTGMSGGMVPDENIKNDLAKLAIQFIAASNKEAIRVFNDLMSGNRVGAGFHLTC